MLIRRAELEDCGITDVRIEQGLIAAIGELTPRDGEVTLNARGGRLLPGLHDHHLHVAALAAALNSVRCGPPDVTDPAAFAACLQTPGTGWLRATGYHESVAGPLDASVLDRIVSHRPVRVQHRSGRLWILNSLALERVLANRAPSPGLERDHDRYTGRLIDDDAWLQHALRSKPPSFAAVGSRLASLGVTGLTEISPDNDARIAQHFVAECVSESLPQNVLLAGRASLTAHDVSGRVNLGAVKLHLHEAHLPALDDVVASIRDAHVLQRVVAVHCASEVELIFALAAFADAGVVTGDRIEHASVAPDHSVDTIAQLGLAVVTQPHFIAERGDAYLEDVEPASLPLLYRLRAFLDAGVALAAGSDAPFGHYDPWASMTSAVARQTQLGRTIGAAEALSPEEALDLYLRDPNALNERRRIVLGAPADLCLLDRPWRDARLALSSAYVRATLINGRLLFDRIDQPPT